MSLNLVSMIVKPLRYASLGTRLGAVYSQQIQNASTATSEWENPKPVARFEKSINQVTLLGRVGAEPQKRGTAEHPVVVFSLATSTIYDSGEENSKKTQKTDWHRVCVFKPSLREMVYQYMNKGNRVLVQGRISYMDSKDENGDKTPTLTSIIAHDITFVSSEKSKSYDDED